MKLEAMGESSMTLSVERLPENEMTEEQKKENIDVSKHCNRIKAAEAAEIAIALANKGNIEEARTNLEQTIKSIKESASAKDDLCATLVQQLETSKSSLASKREYERAGQYQMNKFSKEMKSQRCAASEEPQAYSFETNK